jgi:hypothetical protein
MGPARAHEREPRGENWINDFLYMKQNFEWGILSYTFHPYVIGRGHRMMALEKLLRTLSEQGAQFMTMEQAAREYDEKFPLAPSPRLLNGARP